MINPSSPAGIRPKILIPDGVTHSRNANSKCFFYVSTPLFGVVGFFCLGEGEEKEQVCGQFEPN